MLVDILTSDDCVTVDIDWIGWVLLVAAGVFVVWHLWYP